MVTGWFSTLYVGLKCKCLCYSKSSTSASNLGALDNMMPRGAGGGSAGGSRGSTPPTPGMDVEGAGTGAGETVDDSDSAPGAKRNHLNTPPTNHKEKKKLLFKKV